MSAPNHRLIAEREQHNWSQKELAGYLGTTVGSISRWERQIVAPSPYYRRKLCELFAKEAHELGLLIEPEPPLPELLPETPAALPAYQACVLDPAMPLMETGRDTLLGRESFLCQLRQHLCSARSVALYGLPGVGKTALALSVLEEPPLRNAYSDGVLWAGLGPAPHVLTILSRWGKLLGMTEQECETLTSSEEWAQALRMKLGTRRFLLILDDAYGLEAALALKVGGAHCGYLLTTRFPPLATAFATEVLRLTELAQEDGVRLLTRFVPNLWHTDPDRMQHLVRAVGALPLALVVMGNALRRQAAYQGAHMRRVRESVEALHDAQARLLLSIPTPPADRPPSLPKGGSMSLQTLIAISEQQLSVPARLAFAALSVFPAKPESFSEEAALVVMGAHVDSLDALVDVGLAELVGHDRYTLHQVIADYARTRLHDVAPKQRLIAYVVQFIAVHKLHYSFLEREQGLLLHALELAYTLEPHAAVIEATQQFALFLVTRGLSELASSLLTKSYQAASSLQRPPQAISGILLLAKIAEYQGRYTQARIYVRRGLELAREAKLREETVRLLPAAGVIEVRRGHHGRAEEHFRKGLALTSPQREPEQHGTLLLNLGWIAQSLGHYVQAEQAYRASLQILRTLGERERLCALLLHLGDLLLLQGHLQQAQACYQEGLERARRFSQRGVALGSLLLDLQERQATAEEADALLEAAAAREREGYAQVPSWDSVTYARMNRYVQHRLLLACQMGYQELLCRLLAGLAAIAMSSKAYPQAEQCAKEGLRIARELGDRERCCTFLCHLGEIAFQQAHSVQAEQYYGEVVELAGQMGNGERTKMAHNRLAEMRSVLGEGR